MGTGGKCRQWLAVDASQFEAADILSLVVACDY
jgi:hypothetical protein